MQVMSGSIRMENMGNNCTLFTSAFKGYHKDSALCYKCSWKCCKLLGFYTKELNGGICQIHAHTSAKPFLHQLDLRVCIKPNAHKMFGKPFLCSSPHQSAVNSNIRVQNAEISSHCDASTTRQEYKMGNIHTLGATSFKENPSQLTYHMSIPTLL